ncbi:hypothetical protein V6N11_031416 [Hibiscus sabdariffa]|uniref:Uncharacterized protein n=1 Tax=Hibiscus sabdariffa TaxID=183260 RepID=A0ABR2SYF1_9ROSI
MCTVTASKECLVSDVVPFVPELVDGEVGDILLPIEVHESGLEVKLDYAHAEVEVVSTEEKMSEVLAAVTMHVDPSDLAHEKMNFVEDVDSNFPTLYALIQHKRGRVRPPNDGKKAFVGSSFGRVTS